ncbi:MAG: thrombospondin type 3 repeat-containing protein, partial [Kiritimatiellae bacterium]|nr:thrombospondin type 3 repeat-containing protein [Kiritimatiellia bacterium]
MKNHITINSVSRRAVSLLALSIGLLAVNSAEALILALRMNWPGFYVDGISGNDEHIYTYSTGASVEQVTTASDWSFSCEIVNPDYEFDRWVSMHGYTTFTDAFSPNTTAQVGGSDTVTATFKLRQYPLVVTSDGHHQVVTPPIGTNYFGAGTTRYLTASPTNGYTFLHWAHPDDPTVPHPLMTGNAIVMTTTQQVMAVFRPDPTLVVSSSGEHLFIDPPLGTNSVARGARQYLTATPSNGYALLRWALPSNPTVPHPEVEVVFTNNQYRYSIVVDGDKQVMAVFGRDLSITHRNYNPQQPALTYVQTAVYGSMPTVNVPQPAYNPSSVELYTCAGWTNGGPQINQTGGTTNFAFIEPITNNNELTWRWRHEYAVYAVIGSGQGNIVPLRDNQDSPGDNLNWLEAGVPVSVVAAPSAGNVFSSWSSSPSGLIPPANQFNSSLTITPMQPFTLIANFILQTDDSDGDGLPDNWELNNGLDPNDRTGDNGGGGDPDNDGLNNEQEYFLVYSNAATRVYLRSHPLNGDTDGDGMHDGWEYYMFPLNPESKDIVPPGLDGGNFFVNPETGKPDGRYGAIGNLDGDFRWDETGWEHSDWPFSNIQEYTGPDEVAPKIYELVAPGATASDGWVNDCQATCKRAVNNTADTSDTSNPSVRDCDEDGFDDGFEYSWDRWHRLYTAAGTVYLANTNYWPAITNVVPLWTSNPTDRPFHPSRTATENGNLDRDYFYFNDVSKDTRPLCGMADEASPYYNIQEYRASDFAITNSNPYPFVRVLPVGLRWCTNPFVWDSDYDGLPDGYEISFGFNPWSSPSAGAIDRASNSDFDYYAVIDAVTKHADVYTVKGFNPYTGWGPKDLAVIVDNVPHVIPLKGGVDTADYTAIEELRGTFYPLEMTLDNQLEWNGTHPRH